MTRKDGLNKFIAFAILKGGVREQTTTADNRKREIVCSSNEKLCHSNEKSFHFAFRSFVRFLSHCWIFNCDVSQHRKWFCRSCHFEKVFVSFPLPNQLQMIVLIEFSPRELLPTSCEKSDIELADKTFPVWQTHISSSEKFKSDKTFSWMNDSRLCRRRRLFPSKHCSNFRNGYQKWKNNKKLRRLRINSFTTSNNECKNEWKNVAWSYLRENSKAEAYIEK